ncbi:MAG: FAD-binding protein [Acidobacteriota bacterium]
MATDSLERLLETPFEGRVVAQVDDPYSKYTDFDGNPTILYPWSEEGLRQAVMLRQAMGPKGFIRSGLSSSGDGRTEADGGLVIDLSHFCDIEVAKTTLDGQDALTITVGAAAKTSQLAEELVRANAFLPIGDNPVKSVVSSLLSDQPGYFDRSMGRLRDYVETLHVITPQGDVARVSKGDNALDSILDGAFGGVIQSVAFSAVPASREAIHVTRASLVYSRQDFEDALGLLHLEELSETMDITVSAHHDAYGLGIVSVTAAGRPDDRDQVDVVMDRLMSCHRQRRGQDWTARQTARMVQRVEARNPGKITALILEGGLSGNLYVDRNLICRHYNRVVSLKDFDALRASFTDDLVSALGVEGTGASSDVLGSVRLSLDNTGNLVVNADVFWPAAQMDSLGSASLGRSIRSKPHLAALERHRGMAPLDLDIGALRRVASPADSREIPGFGGQIYAPDDPDYDARRTQYASSSHAHKQRQRGSMRPYLVAYPRNHTDDVAVAIAFAKANGKHVVARSGGHQYSGLSSGGDDTILLSMDLYNHCEIEDVGNSTFARVGVGMLLTDLAAELRRQRVTIPHGECPRVGVGGHVQTGGFGHLLRSYGLTLDHVAEFKIYLHDGQLATVTRPTAQNKDDLYWGVLGGGPGSFGILTEITFDCIRDQDHPDSWGSARTYVYGRHLFRGAMREIQRWTDQIAAGSPSLPKDVDMNVTVVNASTGLGVLLLEMVHGDKEDGGGGTNRAFLLGAKERILSHQRWWNVRVPFQGYEGDKDLSYMSDAKVRRTGTTEDGREFKEPYRKRLNCTNRPLTTEFIEGFVDLIDRVVQSRTVQLVFQMFLGGGAYGSPEASPPLSSIDHRDVTLGIVFDCFYIGRRGLNNARRFQNEMQDLLGAFSGDQEIRMLWGSFGDTDISKEAVRKLYYDDATWSSLQALKEKVDPGDLFHTEFTVQLP